jgi:hypothetical protein
MLDGEQGPAIIAAYRRLYGEDLRAELSSRVNKLAKEYEKLTSRVGDTDLKMVYALCRGINSIH